MAFCFLSDAFPTYNNSQDTSVKSTLYEDFTVSPVSPVSPSAEDSDLLAEKFTDYNLPLVSSKDTPQPFDHSSEDYLKIISSNWEDKTHLAQPKKDTDNNNECLSIAKHLDQCSNCRLRLENIFRKLYQKDEKKTSTLNSAPWAPWYLDIVLLLLIGIFIVFVLDAFVRLGRYLRK